MPGQLLEKDEKGRWFFTRGKHEGDLLDDVASSDPSFLEWLEDRSEAFQYLRKEAQAAITKARG